jgi:hypothetical protein
MKVKITGFGISSSRLKICSEVRCPGALILESDLVDPTGVTTTDICTRPRPVIFCPGQTSPSIPAKKGKSKRVLSRKMLAKRKRAL